MTRTLKCGCRQRFSYTVGGVPYWRRLRKCGKPEGLFLGDVCEHWRKL